MTVQTQSPTQYYSGPITIGTVLSVTDFTFVENSHISVKVRGETTNWTYGTDYTVAGAGTLTRTVTILKAVPANKTLAVFLDVPITQGISPEEGGNLPAETLEYTLDKLTYICQDLNARLKRSLQISIDSTFDGTIYDAPSNIGKAFIVNSVGTGVAFTTYKLSDLEYIANRLYASIGNVDIVANDITNVNTTATNIASVNTTAGSITNVNRTAQSIDNVDVVGTDLALDTNSEIKKVNANKANIDAVAGSLSNIARTVQSIDNVDTVGTDLALGANSDIKKVNANKTNIDTVAASVDNIERTVQSIDNVDTVGEDLALGASSEIKKVNANKAHIDINAANIESIQNAYSNAQTASTKASEASASAITASTQAGNAHIWSEGTDEEVQALGGVHSSKGWAEQSAQGQIQSDWNQTDTTKKDFIKNKPNLENGYFPNVKVGLADNLYDASVPISIGTFNFRTTAGDESVSTGTAILNEIYGAMDISGHTPRSGTATPTSGITVTNFDLDQFETHSLSTGTYTFNYSNGTWTLGESAVTLANYGLTATVASQSLDISTYPQSLVATCTNITTFKNQVNNVTGLYLFTYAAGNWTLGEVQVDLSQYAITITGTPVDGNTISCNFVATTTSGSITVNYTKEILGTITVATPTALKATASMNQYSGSTYIADATINSDGEIVSSVGSKVCYCPAVGGIYSGYVAYSESQAITKIAYHNTVPVMGDTLTLTGTTQDSELSVVLFNTNGYVCVAVTDDSDLSIHPRWSSGQDQDHTYDEYELSTLTLPTVDAEGTTLPWTTAGLAAIDSVYDELNFDSKKYIRRINRLANTPENLAIVQAYGTVYKYDTNYIYYIFKAADIITYDLSQSVLREYIVNDYGTEWFVGTNLELQTNISYGVNLKDKLRTDVVQISQQTLTNNQKRQVQENIGTAIITDTLEEEVLRYDNAMPGVLESPLRVNVVRETISKFVVKAGSELLVPYGTSDLGLQIGSTFINNNFIITDTDYNSGKYFVYVKALADMNNVITSVWVDGEHLSVVNLTDTNLLTRIDHRSGSSTSAESSLFYNTTTNYINDTEHTTKILSFPVCRVAVNPSVPGVSYPLEIFHNMGYIGKTFWIGKKVKIAFSNGKQTSTGKNANIIDTTKHIYTIDYIESDDRRGTVFIHRNSATSMSLSSWGWSNSTNVVQTYSLPAASSNTYTTFYSSVANKWYRIENSTAMSNAFELVPTCMLAEVRRNSSQDKLVGVEINSPFYVVTNNMPSYLTKLSFPSSQSNNNVYHIPLAASGSRYYARYTGYVFAYMRNATSCNLHNEGTRISSVDFTGGYQQDRYAWIPVTSGDFFSFWYSGEVIEFKVIPAWGSVKSII